MRITFFLVITVLLFSCTQKQQNKFSDPVLIKIADLQDRRSTDSIIQFLKSENSVYRKEAALALASVQDSIAAPALANLLLDDKDAEVRINAAFALGQTGTFASVNALIPSLEDSDSFLVREVLEALGKTVTKKDVATLSNYSPKDSLTEEGLTWAFYRLGMRNLSDSLIENRAKEFLDKKYSQGTRLGAAHFFSRTKIMGKGFDEIIINAASNDPSVNIRMAAANALKRITKEKALPVLEKIITTEKDYRVRVGAVRALQPFLFDESSDLLMTALQDSNVNVHIAASEVFKATITEKEKDKIIRRTFDFKSPTNWRVLSNIYEASFIVDSAENIQNEIISVYKSSSDNYQKASLLEVLSKSISAYPFIADELLKSNVPVVKSSAAQALVSINRNKEFQKNNKTAFAELYRRAILDGDPAVIGTVTSALGDSTLGYKEIIKDSNFLAEAKRKLSFPKDAETLQSLNEAIAYFEGKPKPTPLKNPFNHPINWELVKSIGKNQRVSIKTNKGEIFIQLLVEEAPGSVANFVDLLSKKYFDEKFVHRVVPNFVIQTGCYRGDGSGSEDYSIRSEFSKRRYKTGSVGMASSGKDTEGTQWFITHSPTPHLDGRYSIFAEVISGMEVVDKIEVGDRIVTVSLIK